MAPGRRDRLRPRDRCRVDSAFAPVGQRDQQDPSMKHCLTCRCVPGLAERFWSRVDKSPRPEGCWLWMGQRLGTMYDGYGFLVVKRWRRIAHRVAWELTHGTIPEGLLVLHHCDNPPCVNPEHLFVGTQSENMKDMYDKGRRQFRPWLLAGERHPQAKLTLARIKWARTQRENGVSLSALARRFKVARRTLRSALQGRTWKWDQRDDLAKVSGTGAGGTSRDAAGPAREL